MPKETDGEKRVGPPPIPLSVDQIINGRSPAECNRYFIGNGLVAIPSPIKNTDISYIIFLPAPPGKIYEIHLGRLQKLFSGLEGITRMKGDHIPIEWQEEQKRCRIIKPAWVRTNKLLQLQQSRSDNKVVGLLEPNGVDMGMGEIKFAK